MAKPKKSPDLMWPAPQQLALADVNFAPYNPRTMPADMMRALKRSIETHGMVLNLVVQKTGLVLIGGHQRVRAIRELCKERGIDEPRDAWATVLDVDDDQAAALNIALNRIEAEFDPFKLGEVLARITKAPAFDATAIGFHRDEVDELVRQAIADPDELARQLEEEARRSTVRTFGQSITLSIEFETVAERDEAKDMIRKITGGGKPGAAVLAALRAHRAVARKPVARKAEAPT